ncbi:MAG: DNA-binding response regulator, partial [Erysipelotrichaceae bacterium]|nr:DNA-binding response regulator [Erysipelotrichaceae bacterium]
MTRILVVDDEVKIREMICKYAVYEGFETAMAVDGSEAIDKALNE